MTAKEMLGKVDHTQLKAFATWEDIQKLCDEAIQYHTASVCVPPCYIKRIHDTYGDKINTVSYTHLTLPTSDLV